jgi:hypothetical protein
MDAYRIHYMLIPEGTRKDPSYSGYAIACSFEDAAKNFDVL